MVSASYSASRGRPAWLNPRGAVLSSIVFVGGVCSIAVETSASRLVGPYFGSSTFIWANLIGLTLLYLSIGYFLGGKLADRYPEPELLSMLTAVAGFSVAFIPMLSRPILEISLSAFDNVSVGAFYGSLLGTMLLFAVPITLLGCVSPFAVRLRLDDVASAGNTAGSLYALSTVGSIIGSFLPTFVLIPAFGIGYAVQTPGTPYVIFLVLALLCGFGGGNFASSMAIIGFFFPKAQKGNALALNGGLGNLGVSVMQFIVPLVITASVFGALGGDAQVAQDGSELWLQNAGFIWVPFILASSLLAWFGMNDIADAKASFAEQAIIFQRRHNWLMCWLYTGTFGSFIGFSAGLPLLAKYEFPEVDVLKYVFLAPLVGAISRAATGWVSDRFGGARVTFWVFVGMMIGTLGVVHFIEVGNFPGFLATFVFMFFVTGVGNASTFQMIPVIMRSEVPRLMPELSAADANRQAEKESAAIIGFTSAIAAYGAFFIPKAFGSSITLTGAPMVALWSFFVFYASCAALTWFVYTRRGGLLHDIERGRGAPPSTPVPVPGATA